MLVLPVTETTGKGLTVNCEMVVAWQLPIEFLYAKMCVPADNFEASSTPLTLMADDGPENTPPAGTPDSCTEALWQTGGTGVTVGVTG